MLVKILRANVEGAAIQFAAMLRDHFAQLARTIGRWGMSANRWPIQRPLNVAPLTPDLAKQLGLRPGTQGVVVAEVDPAGPALRRALSPET